MRRTNGEPIPVFAPLQPNRIGAAPARRVRVEVPKPRIRQPGLFVVVLPQQRKQRSHLPAAPAAALSAMLSASEPISADELRKRLDKNEDVSVSEVVPYEASLEGYDELLQEVGR